MSSMEQRGTKPRTNPSEIHATPIREEQTVRAILINEKNEILLQEVCIPNKPRFYITPGGRLDPTDNGLISAMLREIKEETGFSPETISIVGNLPFCIGSHIMKKKGEDVKMKENFFLVRLSGVSEIDSSKQSLTPEEVIDHTGQRWFSLSELTAGGNIVLPVNLKDVMAAFIYGRPPPQIDFSDPPEFSA